MGVVKIETRFRKICEGPSDAIARGSAFQSGVWEIAQLRFHGMEESVEVDFTGCLLGGRKRAVERREVERIFHVAACRVARIAAA